MPLSPVHAAPVHGGIVVEARGYGQEVLPPRWSSDGRYDSGRIATSSDPSSRQVKRTGPSSLPSPPFPKGALFPAAEDLLLPSYRPPFVDFSYRGPSSLLPGLAGSTQFLAPNGSSFFLVGSLLPARATRPSPSLPLSFSGSLLPEPAEHNSSHRMVEFVCFFFFLVTASIFSSTRTTHGANNCFDPDHSHLFLDYLRLVSIAKNHTRPPPARPPPSTFLYDEILIISDHHKIDGLPPRPGYLAFSYKVYTGTSSVRKAAAAFQRSQSTISKYLHEVVTALTSTSFHDRWIVQPTSDTLL
ncbi:hypothetical protein I350_03888 [Cryptococcus amylolentus CBS 6273]|uniref:Uncharacterized protein n=1 Tax=Cryptococcus amylolentus CBS 6273 TaxID=1296118 RepID=A0A1E3K0J1_9TREE|nr:hypothetical protein I350_03888 [Cryptococcus amylolentus CBS 6273]